MISRDDTLRLIRERVQHPASARELMQRLTIPREERASFRRQLKALAADGDLVEVHGKRYGLADKMDLVVGPLEAHVGGFGFVRPEGPAGTEGSDVYIAEAHLKEAMHGDRVVARVERHREDGRVEGRIVRILSRANATLVGRFDLADGGLGFVTPFDPRLGADVAVLPDTSGGARPGDMVTVEITRWPTTARGPVGRVTEVLGRLQDPGVDTRVIIRKFHLPDSPGPSALAEAQRLVQGRGAPRSAHARKADVAGRTDFRGLDVVTIDGEQARDFDDAISVERLENGHFRLGVHIADVSHYVREGSALDEEARDRGTSVYFPERALHMFPEELATGLCSLNPRVDRLVQSCLMELDANGEVVRSEFHDGVIRTRERMTYTEVNAILTGSDPATTARYEALGPALETMREVYRVLSERRHRLGSIDFDLREAEFELDEEGAVEAITALDRNLAHRLVEEFMLLANETVATFLDTRGAPGLYRVHEAPDPLKVERFEEFVSTFGYSLGAAPHAVRPRHFQNLLEAIRGKKEERAVALLMLRTMQQARYAPANLGHFGLAFSSYTHFTSPIRRYPDLVVHRLLRSVRDGTLDEPARAKWRQELPVLARHVSDRERRAEEAERELVQWKKVRFMVDKVGEEGDGYVVGVAPFGLFVELTEHFVEGLVRVSSMGDDYYRHLEQAHALRGEHTGRLYRLGDRVRVRVLRVDADRRQVDLGLVDGPGAARSEPSGGRRRGRPPAKSQPSRPRAWRGRRSRR